MLFNHGIKLKIFISSLVIPVHYSVYASFQFGSHIEVIMPPAAKNVRRNHLKKKHYYLHMTLAVLFYKYTSSSDAEVHVHVIEVSHAEL